MPKKTPKAPRPCDLFCTCPLHDPIGPEDIPVKTIMVLPVGFYMVMGIDPGGSCGLAVLGFDEPTDVCVCIGSGTYSHSDLSVMLRHNLPGTKRVGVEEYRNNAMAGANQGSTNETSQTIGMVVETCERMGIPCDVQPPAIKAPALEWARNRWPDLDLSYTTQHEKDAKAHAVWQVRQIVFDRIPKPKGKRK